MRLDPVTRRLLERELKSAVPTRAVMLMYHGISPAGAQPLSPYSTTASRFREHLELLKRYEWHTACVRDLTSPEILPDRTVLISFDDGYADNFEHGFQPLITNGMKATWFVVTDAIGKHAEWVDGDRAQTKMLNIDQLGEMARAGMEIGAHTCTHPNLTTIDDVAVNAEMAGSRAKLEDLLSAHIGSFAYPYGFCNQHTVESAAAAGFDFACSARPGWINPQTEPLLLRRVTVFASDTANTLARKLVFACNDVSWKAMSRYVTSRLIDRLQS
ncbi:polysaccharide deacetylase family protein [Gammaproteobacteria bacterium]|nr:polysaccharide deacetylase family protein [Gammaproteobacteria bacterium]